MLIKVVYKYLKLLNVVLKIYFNANKNPGGKIIKLVDNSVRLNIENRKFIF